MRLLLLSTLILILTSNTQLQAQSGDDHQRSGFYFGIGIGGGELNIDQPTIETQKVLSLPNLKVGYFIKESFALNFSIPVAPYKKAGRDRGFEGFVLSGQYWLQNWLQNKWWIQVGTGVGFDAPAFWTVSDPREENFNLGVPAIMFSTGLEIYKIGPVVFDLHYRYYQAKVELEGDQSQTGRSHMFIIGITRF